MLRSRSTFIAAVKDSIKTMTDKAQIYLIAPPIADVHSASEKLTHACESGNVAAILLSFTDADERAQIKAIKTIAPPLQKLGAAVITRTSALVAARGGADGVHIDNNEALPEAIEALKPERIIGIGNIKTRHEAMSAGEMDIDYLTFGEPRPDGSLPDLEPTLERVRWWAEIFSIPCVGFVHHLSDVVAMVETGAEFIGLGDAVFLHPEGPAAALAQVEAAIAVTNVPDRNA